MSKGKEFISQLKLHSDYLKWDANKYRYETWEEACDKVLDTHIGKYGSIVEPYINEIRKSYHNKEFLSSQRNLQFRGESVYKNNAKIYNCVTTYAYSPDVFNRGFFVLLSGCGLGVSLKNKFVTQLPPLHKRLSGVKLFTIPDSIEGWADAIKVLISSYCQHKSLYKEYYGKQIKFDYSEIRPKGAYITGGFKAPGPDGLKQSIERIEKLIDYHLNGDESIQFKSIIVYDILMHISDAVLSGGIRRAAMNVIVDEDDIDMMTAKTGNWRTTNPQRARSNNSVGLLKGQFSEETLNKFIAYNNGDNDIGFVFMNHEDEMFNPCLTGDSVIETHKGKMKLIDLVNKINEGEIIYVMSYNESKDEFEYDLVTNAMLTQEEANIIELTVYDNNTNITHKLKCTSNHKIYTKNRGYVKAIDLESYDELIIFNPNNLTYSICNLYYMTLLSDNEDVYDISVQNNHNFIANNILVHNCFEIGFNFYNKIYNKSESVFQFCNLCEINASACVDSKGHFSEAKFYDICRNAAIIGTLQAGYCEFPYLGKQTEDIVKGEALLGVSITGWMTRPELFNQVILNKGAEIIKATNEEVANVININKAARLTTTKPSGNASVTLKTASGIHPEHSKRYFRIMQLNKDSETAKFMEKHMPSMLEESKWSATNADYVVYSPCENIDGTIYKNDMQGVKHLQLIELVQNSWINSGKRPELCYNPLTTHNVSNTIIIDDINEISQYIYNHQQNFAAVSFISLFGDKDYVQAPFTSVLNTQELVEQYGDGVMFMAGLIVDGLHYFDDDLWQAVAHVLDPSKKLTGDRDQTLLKVDWIRRVKKYAKNYFKGDIQKTIYCMKDVHLWHKWKVINREFKLIDFNEILSEPKFESIDKYVAMSCNGGSCEIV